MPKEPRDLDSILSDLRKELAGAARYDEGGYDDAVYAEPVPDLLLHYAPELEQAHATDRNPALLLNRKTGKRRKWIPEKIAESYSKLEPQSLDRLLRGKRIRSRGKTRGKRQVFVADLLSWYPSRAE